MLVKCSWCQKNFNSERYGRQFCPHCGAELDLPLPGSAENAAEPRMLQPGQGAVPPSPAQPPPQQQALPPWGASGGGEGSASGGDWGDGGGFVGVGSGGRAGGGGGDWGGGAGDLPQDADAPWERRRELGFWPALLETWKQASLDPKRFYARLKTTDIREAFLYGWLLSSIGYLIGGAWALPIAIFTGNDTSIAFGQIFAAPILSAIGLFIGAGIIHLACMILGCATRGFDATFRTVAYAQGPQILAFVPIVGGLVASLWVAVITIHGLAAMQRTTPGRATAAVLLPGILLLVCCGCIAALGFYGVMAATGMGSF